jgi:Txe/YoeB family toxin of Txe-Axe toxin-antitoxin module
MKIKYTKTFIKNVKKLIESNKKLKNKIDLAIKDFLTNKFESINYRKKLS